MNKVSDRYSIRENILAVGDTEIVFDFPIVQVVEMSGRLVVRLEKPFKTIYNENIFGVSLAEKKISCSSPNPVRAAKTMRCRT